MRTLKATNEDLRAKIADLDAKNDKLTEEKEQIPVLIGKNETLQEEIAEL